jgi:hypothetical protein
VLQNGDTIVTDGRQPQSALTEAFAVFVQLDQLTLAVWSPVCGAVKDNHGAGGALNVRKCPLYTVLIEEMEPRDQSPRYGSASTLGGLRKSNCRDNTEPGGSYCCS